MDAKKQAASRAIDSFLMEYLEQREWFLVEAADEVELHPRDERALSVGLVTWHITEPQVSFIFRCAYCLNPNAAPVTDWVDECVEAAKTALPEVFGAIERVDIVRMTNNGPLRHP